MRRPCLITHFRLSKFSFWHGMGFRPADMWSNDSEVITNLVDRDLSAAKNWANVSIGSFDNTADLSLSASAAGQSASLNSAFLGALAPGLRYQISCDVASLVGTFLLKGSLFGTVGTISANGRFTGTFVYVSTLFGNLDVVSGGSGAVDLDNSRYGRLVAFSI